MIVLFLRASPILAEAPGKPSRSTQREEPQDISEASGHWLFDGSMVVARLGGGVGLQITDRTRATGVRKHAGSVL